MTEEIDLSSDQAKNGFDAAAELITAGSDAADAGDDSLFRRRLSARAHEIAQSPNPANGIQYLAWALASSSAALLHMYATQVSEQNPISKQEALAKFQEAHFRSFRRDVMHWD